MNRKLTSLVVAAAAASVMSVGVAQAAEPTEVVQPGTETPTTGGETTQPGTETPAETPDPTTGGGTQPGTETPVETPTNGGGTQPGTETPDVEVPVETPVETPVDTTVPTEETPAPVTETPSEPATTPVTEAPATTPAATGADQTTPSEPVAVITDAPEVPVAPAPAPAPAKPVVLSEGKAEFNGPGVQATAGYVTIPFETTVNAGVKTSFGEFNAPEVKVGTYDADKGSIDFSVGGDAQNLTLAKPVADGVRMAADAVPAQVTEDVRKATESGNHQGAFGQWDASAIWGAESLRQQ